MRKRENERGPLVSCPPKDLEATSLKVNQSLGESRARMNLSMRNQPKNFLGKLGVIEFLGKDSKDFGHRFREMFKVLEALHD